MDKMNKKYQRSGEGGGKILQSRKSSQRRWHWNKVYFCCLLIVVQFQHHSKKGPASSMLPQQKQAPAPPFLPYPRPVCLRANFPQPCPTLFDPMDYIVYQAPLSTGFSRQEYWSGLPCPLPGNLPNPGIQLVSYVSCICKQALYHLGSPPTQTYSQDKYTLQIFLNKAELITSD